MMRRSLSAVSSSTELEAVFASTPSFFRRSMTSWLVSFRSRASVKTLTFPIRRILLCPLGTPPWRRGCLGSFRLNRGRGRGCRAGLGFRGGRLRRDLLGLRPLGRDALGLLGSVVGLPL